MCFQLQLFFQGGEFEEVNPVQGPSVGADDLLQLGAGFRERDEHAAFIMPAALQQKLERESGFADSGIALQEISPIGWNAPVEDFIESFHTESRTFQRF